MYIGLFWYTLVFFWFRLISFGVHCSLLIYIGLFYKSRLMYIGLFWCTLVSFDLYWSLLQVSFDWYESLLTYALHLIASSMGTCAWLIFVVAVCCSVLQCAAVWCSVMQCVAVCCSVCLADLCRSALHVSFGRYESLLTYSSYLTASLTGTRALLIYVGLFTRDV